MSSHFIGAWHNMSADARRRWSPACHRIINGTQKPSLLGDKKKKKKRRK